VEAVAHLVAPLLERRAWRDDFDERESFFLESLADRPGKLPHVKGRPARDLDRARGLDQMRQIERRFKGAVRIRRRPLHADRLSSFTSAAFLAAHLWIFQARPFVP
jgi:hypothetical protein